MRYTGSGSMVTKVMLAATLAAGSAPACALAETEHESTGHEKAQIEAPAASICGESEELAQAEQAEQTALATRDAARAEVDELSKPTQDLEAAKAEAAGYRDSALDAMKEASETADAAFAHAAEKKAAADDELKAAQDAKTEAESQAATASENLAAAEKAADEAQAALDEARITHDDTTYGFFLEIGATEAADIVKNPEARSGVSDTGTNLGDAADATSIDNAIAALAYVYDWDRIRSAAGLPKLKITPTLMAMSEVQCNYASKSKSAMTAASLSSNWYPTDELISWTGKSPFYDWYTTESSYFIEALDLASGYYPSAGIPATATDAEAYDLYQTYGPYIHAAMRYQATVYPGYDDRTFDNYLTLVNPNLNTIAISICDDGSTLDAAILDAAASVSEKTYSMQEMNTLLHAYRRNPCAFEEASYAEAVDAYNSAYSAAENAPADVEAAQERVDEAQAAAQSAQEAFDDAKEAANGYAPLRTEAGRESAFENGIDSYWIAHNDLSLTSHVREQRAAYEHAQEQIEALQKDADANADALASAKSELAGAQAAYDAARGAAIEQRAAYYGEHPFPDVSASEYYYGGVYYSAARKLMTGYDGGTFGPANVLTRGQLATVLWRAARPAEAAAYDAPTATNSTGMADVADGAYYTAAANWAVENKVINGFDEGDHRAFRPDEAVTMEQFSTILVNFSGMADAAKADREKYAAALTGAFTDSGAISDWAVPSVGYAAAQSWFKGYDNGDGTRTLAPGEALTRGRAATVLSNMGFAKEDPSKK